MPAALLLAWRHAGLPQVAAERFDAVMAAMPTRVTEMQARELRTSEALMRTWSHAAAFSDGPWHDDRGGWVACMGNPGRRDLHAGAASAGRKLSDELRRDFAATLDTLSPPFALVAGGAGTLEVAVDRCGLQHLYTRSDDDGTIWFSSSALALATLGATVDADAAAEWLSAGHFVSERTFVREIRKVGAGEHVKCDSCGARTVARRGNRLPEQIRDESDYRDALVRAVGAIDASESVAAELTGGLDSRLVLAARLSAGTQATNWTIGDPGCADLRTARRLSGLLALEHRAVYVGADAHRIAELTLAMHELSDGEVNALEYAPLILAFEALQGRHAVSLSGAGGETGRGYYHGAIRDEGGVRVVDRDALVEKLGAATRPLVGLLSRERFGEPLEPLGRAVDDVLAGSAGRAPELRLDDFYLRARMQRFGGRNTSTTGLYWRQALPFFENEVIAATLALDPSRKRGGAAMRAAIAELHPAISRIPLDTGMSVAPRSIRSPSTMIRWTTAMARKAGARHAGSAMRRARLLAPDAVPWDAIRMSRPFRDMVGDLLLTGNPRVHALLDGAGVRALAERSLAGGNLYAVGSVLTLELTLRRLNP